ncbi:hypothetical protein EDC96DRAFT_546335 [Choanephora cucurbitarum]|nr:hypothetical protein EDC96DRAFT_546335 [Choanephora cucurbitarum]
MLSRELPSEVHFRVLKHLNYSDLKQYGLVSRQWRRMAQHALFEEVSLYSEEKLDSLLDMLTGSPFVGSSVSIITLSMPISKNRASQYSRLIRLTPNVKTLRAKANDERLFQTVLLEMQKGHWKQLHRVLEEDMSNNVKISLCRDYYRLISTIQDKIVFVMLNIPSDPNSLNQPSCFQFPSYITKQTRFNAAEALICSSRGKAEIKVLEDALALCPNAVCLVLSHTSLDWYEDRTTNIEPNTTVKGFSVTLGEYTEGSLNYICQKFPEVEDLISQLSLQILHTGPINAMFRWSLRKDKSNDSLRLCRMNGQEKHDKSKSRLSTLHIEGDIEYLEDDLSETVKAYFGQLDEFDMNQGGRTCDRLLEYCPQLRRTRNGYCYESMHSPELPDGPCLQNEACFIATYVFQHTGEKLFQIYCTASPFNTSQRHHV